MHNFLLPEHVQYFLLTLRIPLIIVTFLLSTNLSWSFDYGFMFLLAAIKIFPEISIIYYKDCFCFHPLQKGYL